MDFSLDVAKEILTIKRQDSSLIIYLKRVSYLNIKTTGNNIGSIDDNRSGTKPRNAPVASHYRLVGHKKNSNGSLMFTSLFGDFRLNDSF